MLLTLTNFLRDRGLPEQAERIEQDDRRLLAVLEDGSVVGARSLEEADALILESRNQETRASRH